MDFDYSCSFFDLYTFAQRTKPTKSTSSCEINNLNGLSKNKKSAPLHLNSDFGHCIFCTIQQIIALVGKKVGLSLMFFPYRELYSERSNFVLDPVVACCAEHDDVDDKAS